MNQGSKRMMWKKSFKYFIDLLMIALFVLLMSNQYTGQLAHEWIGSGMLFVVLMHHWLNRTWYKALSKGNYNIIRMLQTSIDFILLLLIIAMMVSGILLSRYVFVWLQPETGMNSLRLIHLASSHWTVLLMAAHLGLYLSVFLKRIYRNEKQAIRVIFRLCGIISAIFGLISVMQLNFVDYMFLQTEFYQYSEDSFVLYMIRVVSILLGTASLTHLFMKLKRRIKT
ncbi:MAG: DUF4405 domain-containing protein [Lachnospiraceae bacterium]|nr:DUF4405 domain-containing protein [Lachnospiraceae bacterium]